MTDYPGPERRKENLDLESRVRDLEEENRSSIKSRQAMHRQLGDLSVKVDLVLSRMDDKFEECSSHKTETALLKAAHSVLANTISTMAVSMKDLGESTGKSIKDLGASTATAIKDIQDDQKWATRAAATGLVATVGGLAAYIWKVTIGR